MTTYFEKQKTLFYTINALSNTSFIKENMEDICRWLFSSDNPCPQYKWMPTESENNKDNFEEFAEKHTTQAIQKIKHFANHLKTIPLARKKYTNSILENNLQYLKNLFNLTEQEKEFLGFFIRERYNDSCQNSMSNLKKHSRNTTAEDYAVFLNININNAFNCCRKDATLHKLGLIRIDYDGEPNLSGLAKHCYFQRFKNAEDIKSYILGKPVQSNLDWNDFKHIKQIDILEKILHNAVRYRQTGVNILLYGEPGTGKTEFAKTLTHKIATEMYAIGENNQSSSEEDDENNRYAQLIQAQKILEESKNTVLMIDEADDILGGCFINKKHASKKIKVNRLLETNNCPCIWISNNIECMDKAYLRRFTYAIHFKQPKQSVRTEMWQKNLKMNNLPADKKTAETFAQKYSLSPSFITSAVKSAKLINGGLKEVELTLDVLQEAYNNGNKTTNDIVKPVTDFNIHLLNTDTDLNRLTKRVVALDKLNFSLCLYGVSGTGKSAYAQYLGEQMNIPVLKKKCSDLLSMYVGGSEKNIAAAFEEAADTGALLIFDEADSFLQDRNDAVRNWEITQVNEMLVQMEKHPFPFVCTTNLMDKLDKASLRRFTFKVKYDYMTEEQRIQAFRHFFTDCPVDLSHLTLLTPADFAVIKHKAEILGCTNDAAELVKMLEIEQLNKAPINRKIGFI